MYRVVAGIDLPAAVQAVTGAIWKWIQDLIPKLFARLRGKPKEGATCPVGEEAQDEGQGA